MATKLNDPCLNKAFEDEPIFVLLARDPSAPKAVLEWIKTNVHIQPVEKLREAFELALKMVEVQPLFVNRKEETLKLEFDRKSAHLCVCRIPTPGDDGYCAVCRGALTT